MYMYIYNFPTLSAACYQDLALRRMYKFSKKNQEDVPA